MNRVTAGLRYPLSLGVGLMLTGSLFWTLWVFTGESFQYDVIPAVEIKFTRMKPDEVILTRDRTPKPERPDDIKEVDLPPFTTEIGTDVVVDIPRTAVAIPQLAGNGIPMGRDGDVAPLVRIQPTYPPREAARGIEGWVTLQFDISATGSVMNVVVVESEPGTAFDKAAVDAVARWRYNPRVVNGQAVERVGIQTKISFDLEDE